MKPHKIFFILSTVVLLLSGPLSTAQEEDLNQLLLEVVESGDEIRFDSLVAKGASIHTTSSDRKSLLYKAVENGNKEIANKLISLKASVHAGDANGRTPLYPAVSNEDCDMILTLLGQKANPDEGLKYAIEADKAGLFDLFLSSNARPEPVVSWAVEHRRPDLVDKCLTVYGGDADHALSEAVKQSHLDLVQSLVTNKIEAAALIEIVKTTAIDFRAGRDAGSTALFTLNKPNLDIAVMAMERGADPNRHLGMVIDNDNLLMLNLLLMDESADLKRALDYAIQRNRTGAALLILDYVPDVNDGPFIEKAARHGNLEVAEALLSKGADANAGMFNAVKSDNADLVRLLLDYGADAGRPQYLSTAAENGNLEMVEFLLENDAIAEHGMLSAVENGHLAIVKTLIDHGVDGSESNYVVKAVENAHPAIVEELLQYSPELTHTNYLGHTLLHTAAENRDVLTGRLLIKSALEVEKTDHSGNTPLHLAAGQRRNVAFCQLLVENGANVNARNQKGKTVLKMARGSKNKNYLKSMGAEKE